MNINDVYGETLKDNFINQLDQQFTDIKSYEYNPDSENEIDILNEIIKNNSGAIIWIVFPNQLQKFIDIIRQEKEKYAILKNFDWYGTDSTFYINTDDSIKQETLNYMSEVAYTNFGPGVIPFAMNI